MRLKHIKLAGFKSFVDPTVVPFEQQMTAIVGPNGCGKSNVIDAVRWVLGESSAKNLRGDAMTDVIFNGSGSRKPIGQASVELVFDNTEGRIQGNMADRAQVSVRRVINREGVNHYFLNGTGCRRRDITDIFLGTGLGPRSYAIIEQGTISRLIESKPQELRVFIEEAAGISKYKERRKETENRIRHTRENLVRLNDIRIELDVQIDKLHQQSEAAKRFRHLKHQERKCKAELAVLRWKNFEQQREQHQKRVVEIEINIAKKSTLVNQHELDIIHLKETLVSASERNQALQQEKLDVTQDIARAEQNIKHLQEQVEKSNSDHVLMQQKLLSSQQLIHTEQEKLQQCLEQLTLQQPELEKTENALTTNQAALEEQQNLQKILHEKWQAKQKQQQEQQKNQQEYQQRKQSVLGDIAQQQIIFEQITLRIDNLNEQLSLIPQVNNLTISQHQQEKVIIEKTIKTLQVKKNDFLSIERDLLTQNKALNQQLSTISAQQAVKKQVIGDISGKIIDKTLWSEKQEHWFKKQHNLTLENVKSVQSQLNVETGWELAVEVVLSHIMAGHVIDVLPDADKNNHLSIDTLCLVYRNETDLVKPNSLFIQTNANSLASKVSGLGELIPWFNQILIASDYAAAKDQVTKLKLNESLICQDGTWLSPYCLRKGRFEQGYDYMSLQRDLIAQQTLLAEYVAKQVMLEGQQEKNNQQIHHYQLDISECRRSIEQHQNQLHVIQQKVSLFQQEQSHYQRERKKLQEQVDNELAKQELTQQRINKCEQQLLQLSVDEIPQTDKAALDEHTANDISLDEYYAQHEILQTAIEELQRHNQSLNKKRHQLGTSIAQFETKKVQYEQSITIHQERINALTQKLASYSQNESEYNTPLQGFQQSLPQWLDKLSQVNEQLSVNQTLLNDSQTQLSVVELELKSNQNKVSTLNEQLNRLQLESEGFKLRSENALEMLTELQQNVDNVIEQMPAQAKESLWQAQLIKLSKDIQLLGAINLAAIDEYEKQVERKNYLDQQDQDLNSAIVTLESAIAKIDKESRDKFKLTFDQIDNDLQRLFPKVFGGGRAYLALTGEDLLDTGVTIMARPPGKKNSTIHLLSGGEKALTALSLVFAIFRLNPAPFCLLDEVDAPLDDANVGRFCNLVQEMSKTVQFIYISHNKIAMEMASHLTGITMFEPGVSRMVAVDIDEAIAMSQV